MEYELPVAQLLGKAARGDESAWNTIVRRYQPLVVSVCRRYQVGGADAEDVAGNVWFRLVTNLKTIRQPAALPGWLATTAQRECLMLLRERNRQVPDDGREIADEFEPACDVRLLTEERHNALRDAFKRLPDRDRELMTMLFSDPPTPYSEISSNLGMPVGAIGPTRQRCIARLRRTPAMAALLLDERHMMERQSA